MCVGRDVDMGKHRDSGKYSSCTVQDVGCRAVNRSQSLQGRVAPAPAPEPATMGGGRALSLHPSTLSL